MAGFTEANRVQIRKYLGFAALYRQAEPRLESAMTALQAAADGGSRPDTSAQIEALAIVAKLQAIDAQIELLMTAWGSTSVDEIKLDTAREDARLRKNGRAYVARLARMLDTYPIADAFSGSRYEGYGLPHAPRY